MPATMSFGSLYPGRPTTQEKTNVSKSGPAPSASAPGGKTSANWNVPVLNGVATTMGLSVPALVTLGAVAWFLFRQYD